MSDTQRVEAITGIKDKNFLADDLKTNTVEASKNLINNISKAKIGASKVQEKRKRKNFSPYNRDTTASRMAAMEIYK